MEKLAVTGKSKGYLRYILKTDAMRPLHLNSITIMGNHTATPIGCWAVVCVS